MQGEDLAILQLELRQISFDISADGVEQKFFASETRGDLWITLVLAGGAIGNSKENIIPSLESEESLREFIESIQCLAIRGIFNLAFAEGGFTLYRILISALHSAEQQMTFFGKYTNHKYPFHHIQFIV